MVDIIIRRFTIKDYPGIVTLWEKAKLSYRPEGRDSCEKIREQMDNGTSVFLIAELDSKIVGCVLGTHDGRKGWMNRLAVDPELRRKHIASRLIKEMERIFDGLGLEVMAGLIETNNEISKKVFKKLGYEYYPVEYYSKRKSLKS